MQLQQNAGAPIGKKEIQHNFPVPHKDVLEQFIAYEVPEEKFSVLPNTASATADPDTMVRCRRTTDDRPLAFPNGKRLK